MSKHHSYQEAVAILHVGRMRKLRAAMVMGRAKVSGPQGQQLKQHLNSDPSNSRAMLPAQVSEVAFVVMRGFNELVTHADGERDEGSPRADWTAGLEAKVNIH